LREVAVVANVSYLLCEAVASIKGASSWSPLPCELGRVRPGPTGMLQILYGIQRLREGPRYGVLGITAVAGVRPKKPKQYQRSPVAVLVGDKLRKDMSVGYRRIENRRRRANLTLACLDCAIRIHVTCRLPNNYFNSERRTRLVQVDHAVSQAITEASAQTMLTDVSAMKDAVFTSPHARCPGNSQLEQSQ